MPAGSRVESQPLMILVHFRLKNRVGKFLPERKKPVAKTGNNRHGKNLVAKNGKNWQKLLRLKIYA